MVAMRLTLSEMTVRKLIFMLDDCYRFDVGQNDEHKIWGDFDCLNIISDLITANGNRFEDGSIDVKEETVEWMAVILENMLSDIPLEKHHLSDITLKALSVI